MRYRLLAPWCPLRSPGRRAIVAPLDPPETAPVTRRAALLALLALLSACSTDLPTTCADLPSPVGLDLSGPWQVQTDPDGIGEQEFWPQQDLPSPLAVTVPGCLDAAVPELHGYVGKSWWQTTFTAPTLAADERAWLVLDGVALRARVFLDYIPGHWSEDDSGFEMIVVEQVGEVPRDHLRAEFDVTDFMTFGEHRLSIEVDNTILERSIPDTAWNGWWNHTGIIRPVRLEVRPSVALTSLRMDTTLNADGTWHAVFTASVRSGEVQQRGELTLSLLDEGSGCATVFQSVSGRTVAQGESELVVEADLTDVTPWAPRALPGAASTGPHLYRLVATLDTDAGSTSRTVRTAFREARLDGPRVLWNGQPLTLRGVNRHELHPDTGFTLSETAQRTDLEGIAALGANTVRLAHTPQSQAVLDLCDELGLLAWVEIPAWRTRAETLADPQVWSQVATPFLTRMVEDYRYHPSVLFWGIGNELDSRTPEIEGYCEQAAALVRGLDPSRLVTFASDKHEDLPLAQVDRCFQHLDVVAINEDYGWTYEQLTDLGPALDALHAAFPAKPVLVSEFGAEDDGEGFQSTFLAAHLDQIEDPARSGWMLGGLIGVWADFAAPSGMNLKGLVTERREKKRAWDLVKTRWSK